MPDAHVPYGNDCCFSFPFPEEIEKKTGSSGWTMPIRNFFEAFARVNEDCNPKWAAVLREAASYYPHVDNLAHEVKRDGNGAILDDFDDWDEISDEEKINRGSRYAAIANLDRLRFDLEMMGDEPEHKEKVTNIRRRLAELAFED